MDKFVKRLLIKRGGNVTQELPVINKKATELYNQVSNNLKEKGCPEKAIEQKSYMKGIPFKFNGIQAPQIYNSVRQLDSKLPFYVQYDLFEQLMKSDIFDHKLFAIKLLERNYKEIDEEVLAHMLQLLRESHIYGWALCDTLSKPLRLASLHRGPAFDALLLTWQHEQEITWIRRTALVTFVVRAKHGDNPPNYSGFLDKLYEMCKECLKYDERFNQLAVGWLLREMGVADQKRVINFIEENYRQFTREGLRYAVEKMQGKTKKRLMELGQNQKVRKEPKKKVMKK